MLFYKTNKTFTSFGLSITTAQINREIFEIMEKGQKLKKSPFFEKIQKDVLSNRPIIRNGIS